MHHNKLPKRLIGVLLTLTLMLGSLLAPTVYAAPAPSATWADIGAYQVDGTFSPSSEVSAVVDSSSVLDETDIVYMILTDRFYDGNPANNGTLNHEYRPGELKYTQGGDWVGMKSKLQYVKNLGVTAIWISPPSQNELLSRTAPNLAIMDTLPMTTMNRIRTMEQNRILLTLWPKRTVSG